MTPEEIEAMKKENAEMKKSIEEKDKLIKERDSSIAEKDKSIAEKDALIKQKNDDIIGARKKYKKLEDMSEEEREQLSEKELELQERQEEMERQQEEFQKQQMEVHKKEVEARRESAIKKLTGDNKEYADKLRQNFDSIKDSENASTEEEISGLMNTAFNMLGDDKPNPVTESVNGAGGNAPEDTTGEGFAESQEGKDLANMMGISADGTAPTPDGQVNS